MTKNDDPNVRAARDAYNARIEHDRLVQQQQVAGEAIRLAQQKAAFQQQELTTYRQPLAKATTEAIERLRVRGWPNTVMVLVPKPKGLLSRKIVYEPIPGWEVASKTRMVNSFKDGDPYPVPDAVMLLADGTYFVPRWVIREVVPYGGDPGETIVETRVTIEDIVTRLEIPLGNVLSRVDSLGR